MKIFIFLLQIFFLVVPEQAGAQDAEKRNCTQQMEEFYNYRGNATDEMKINLQVCKGYCSKISNLPDAREFCGIEDCKYLAAEQGEPSSWCCDVANYWQGKLGTKENPLESIMSTCHDKKLRKPSFIDCANKIRAGITPADGCCEIVRDVKKFDPIMARDLSGFCKKRKIPMKDPVFP